MMAKGKMKSVYGIYKKHGREAFLDAAEYYSCHVNPDSVEKTIDEMESRWYDRSHTLTEAEQSITPATSILTALRKPSTRWNRAGTIALTL